MPQKLEDIKLFSTASIVFKNNIQMRLHTQQAK